MWKQITISLALLATSVAAQDVIGDLNTNISDSTVDSNNSSDDTTNNYNATGAGSPAPVMSAIAPTMMGGGGNDSCLIPNSKGLSLSIIGISEGAMTQDNECNRRKDARLLGAPQQVGGLGLQVSAISIMCTNPVVYKSMALANTPCPITDIVTGKLLIGRSAYIRMREKPSVYIVGYDKDKIFWDTLLMIGRKLPDAPKEETTDLIGLSDRFRSNRKGGTDDKRPPSSRRSN
jgi:hypothetical protein